MFLTVVETGPLPGEGSDAAAFKMQRRRPSTAIKASLVASGADFSAVVQMQTFHRCKSATFAGDCPQQRAALIAVNSEFMRPPAATGTAICVDRPSSDNAVVEIQMPAYAPQGKRQVAAAMA